MGPAKRTLFVPACAENFSVPAVMVRVQRCSWLVFLASGRHGLPNLRPLAGSVKVKVTLAGSFRLKEKVVPTGVSFLPLELIEASGLASRQVPDVSRRPLSVGV